MDTHFRALIGRRTGRLTCRTDNAVAAVQRGRLAGIATDAESVVLERTMIEPDGRNERCVRWAY